MQFHLPKSFSCSLRHALVALAAATTLVAKAPAQTVHDVGQAWAATPFGEASTLRPEAEAQLSLSLAWPKSPNAALRLEGGTPGKPAAIMIGDAPAPIGHTRLLVNPGAAYLMGTFNANGVFQRRLDELPAKLDLGVYYAQGIERRRGGGGYRGVAFSNALRVACYEKPQGGENRPGVTSEHEFPEFLVDEIAGLLGDANFEQALDLALNSKDDSIAFTINGELMVPVPNPFVPTLSVGGKAQFKAEVKRGANSLGDAIYGISIGGDVANSAGVSAGVAGAAMSSGYGADVIWRFHSAEEVSRAIRSMAILQATSLSMEYTCQILDQHAAYLRDLIAAKRRVADALRARLRRLPFSNFGLVVALQAQIDEFRVQRQAQIDQGLDLVQGMISMVADARRYMDTHLNGAEVRAKTEISASVGTPGIGNPDKNGEASVAGLGASVNAAVAREYVLRTEREPATDTLAIDNKVRFVRKTDASAAALIGVGVGAERVLEVVHRIQVGADGYQHESSGAMVKMTLDGKLLGSLGLLLTAQCAVGGEVTVEFPLRQLLEQSAEAIAILMSDDTFRAAEILEALQVKIEMQTRYEAGLSAGLGVDLGKKWFKAGVSAALTYTDKGTPFTYEGSVFSPDMLETLVTGPVTTRIDGFQTALTELEAEMTRVRNRF